MILKALLVVLFIAATAVHAQQPCLGAFQFPHSFAASPRSCRHYIICMNGDTIDGETQQCLPGQNFEPQSQTCGQASCLDCSPFGIQNLPHPQYCNKFIECRMGHREIRDCPNGLMFDRRIGQCNLAHEVICGDPWDTTTEDPWWTTDDPWGTTTEDPWWTTDDPWGTTTEDPWGTTTEDPWGTPGPPLPRCLAGQVFHAHPTECDKYFMCVNLVLWNLTCPNSLHWNQRRNTCDFPASAGCIHGGGGITTDPPLNPPPTDPTYWPSDPTYWPTDSTYWPTETWPTTPWPTTPWPDNPIVPLN